MRENKMDNRGSSSVAERLIHNTMSVKEQRVYGICCNKNMQFRFTLMDLKRGYQKKFPSNQLIVQNFNLKLNPWFVTGFYDGEGSFIISITRAVKIKIIS